MLQFRHSLAKNGHPGVGEILVDLGVVTPEQLAEAVKEAEPLHRNLLDIIAKKGFASEERLLKAIAVRYKVPYFTNFEDLGQTEAAELVPAEMARKLMVFPLRKLKKGLLLAMVDPLDVAAIDVVAAHAKLPILPALTTRRALFEAIQKVYGAGPQARRLPTAGPPGLPTAPVKSMPLKIMPQRSDKGLELHNAEDVSVIQLVESMIAQAVIARCSDIHLEPTLEGLVLRLRIDGMLQDLGTYPKALEPAITARIKILAQMDITETRLPQDGHLAVDYGGRSVDLRVSTLPTAYGEKVVLRVLDEANSRRTLAHLGLPPEMGPSFEKVIRSPMALLLVTGPTGSGKTTTLYAGLNSINTRDRNIVTLEDPIEYRLAGINQVEVNPRIGLTFGSGLRAIVRQDPNVILVGEIRDTETAEISIHAALTGHMVMTTLHTRNAVGAISRLVNMKVEPYLLAAALTGVIAQRLLRLLCDRCKKPKMPDPRDVDRLGVPLKQPGPFYASVGCDHCMGTGYAGRVGIYEWLLIEREMRNLIVAGATEDQLAEAARASGVKSLQESGLERVYQGTTSLEEVVRVTREG